MKHVCDLTVKMPLLILEHQAEHLALTRVSCFLEVQTLEGSKDGSRSWVPANPVDVLDCVMGSRLWPSSEEVLSIDINIDTYIFLSLSPAQVNIF